jgi:hypothetical protein
MGVVRLGLTRAGMARSARKTETARARTNESLTDVTLVALHDACFLVPCCEAALQRTEFAGCARGM